MHRKPVISLLLTSSLSLIFIFVFISREHSDIIVITETQSKKFELKTLSNDFLDQAVFKRKDKIKSCFENKISYGYITVKMTISRSGSNKIHFLESDLKENGAIQCIMILLEKIKFPSFKGFKIARTYTLNILPKGK